MAVQAVLPCLVPALAQVPDERLHDWCGGLQGAQLPRSSCAAATEQVFITQDRALRPILCT